MSAWTEEKLVGNASARLLAHVNTPSLDRRLEQARVLLVQEDYTAALSVYRRLSRQFTRSAEVWLEYGAAAAGAQQFDVAEKAWEQAAALRPEDAELLLQIGHQMVNSCRNPQRGLIFFERASRADPRGINPLISLAMLYERQHQLGQSRALLARCLAMEPQEEQANYFLAVLDRREKHLEQAEARLRGLIARGPKHPYVRYACHYELAAVLDATSRPDEAMAHLAQAKRLVGALGDLEGLARTFDAEAARRLEEVSALPKNVLRIWARAYRRSIDKTAPGVAFLGGHPRSGTTLLEQVLGSHPNIAALDEPSTFQRLVAPRLKSVAGQVGLKILRRLYLRGLQDQAKVGAGPVVMLDKNPSLTMWLDVLLRLLPDLPVVVGLRDPRDVLLSCYFQNLPLNVANSNFLSLERLVNHYGALMDLWLVVREWEGLCYQEVRYEDLVADLEKTGREATAFLGQRWHEAQARFYEQALSKGACYAPTYRDVTQPVYRAAVARWKNYEKHLAPILPLLKRYCRAFSYE